MYFFFTVKVGGGRRAEYYEPIGSKHSPKVASLLT